MGIRSFTLWTLLLTVASLVPHIALGRPIAPALSTWSSLCDELGCRYMTSILVRRSLRWFLLWTAGMFAVF